MRSGRPSIEAWLALSLLKSANLDGLDSGRYLATGIEQALADARTGTPGAAARAEIMLSSSFAQYVRDVRRPRSIDVIYGEPGLKPRPPSVLTVLSQAAAAPSLRDYLENVRWMHPIYAGLRRELGSGVGEGRRISEDEQQLLRVNLDRASVLPAHSARYILVDAAAAQLQFVEGGIVRKTMRVVVGTADQPTPMMVGMMRYATLNPYWHVPPDLARTRIAPRVLSQGLNYFRSSGYEVVADWSRSARVIDPATIDWKAVADGKREILVRQRPGPRNGMGKVKFQFPNQLGIYLHDTPGKQLFAEDQRNYSAGCVRLEQAGVLGDLLFGPGLEPQSDEPEQTMTLPKPVPLYITYLTRAPDTQGQIVQRKDAYGRDRALLARMKGRAEPAGGT
jgi:murein L,D-transpeptidase YcbB/YkuD